MGLLSLPPGAPHALPVDEEEVDGRWWRGNSPSSHRAYCHLFPLSKSAFGVEIHRQTIRKPHHRPLAARSPSWWAVWCLSRRRRPRASWGFHGRGHGKPMKRAGSRAAIGSSVGTTGTSSRVLGNPCHPGMTSEPPGCDTVFGPCCRGGGRSDTVSDKSQKPSEAPAPAGFAWGGGEAASSLGGERRTKTRSQHFGHRAEIEIPERGLRILEKLQEPDVDDGAFRVGGRRGRLPELTRFQAVARRYSKLYR